MWEYDDWDLDATFPSWAVRRPAPWKYAGIHQEDPWFDAFFGTSFKERCDEALISDHGETRELDFYPEGAVEWVRELD